MNLNVTQRELDALERGQREAILVRNERTRKEYAIISQASFAELQPLLRHVATKQNGATKAEGADTWTEAKNARRVTLINKECESKLSRAEAKELAALESEVFEHQRRVAPKDTHVLDLILEGLKQRAKRERNAG